jgi:hypothetical protein
MNDFGGLIAIVAVVGGLTVPVVALIMDYRRRKLQFDERRLMIERGMTPPPLDAGSDREPELDPATRREKSLQGGIITLFVGIGLGLGAYALTVLPHTYVPRGLAGPLALAAAVVGCVGIGQLLYYAVSRPRGGVQ